MKTCSEIHPNSKINTGFTCCGDDLQVFRSLRLSADALMTMIDQGNRGYSFPLGETYDLYGVRRNTQFEGYGRATECDEQPWRFFISKGFTGDDRDTVGHDYKTFRGALVDLVFHLERLKSLRGESQLTSMNYEIR